MIVVPGDGEEDEALGVGDGELGVGVGELGVGAGVDELCDGVGVGDDVGWASVSNVSAASRIALARDWLTWWSATSRATNVFSWRTTWASRL